MVCIENLTKVFGFSNVGRFSGEPRSDAPPDAERRLVGWEQQLARARTRKQFDELARTFEQRNCPIHYVEVSLPKRQG
jgi:hypothetical protein